MWHSTYIPPHISTLPHIWPLGAPKGRRVGHIREGGWYYLDLHINDPPLCIFRTPWRPSLLIAGETLTGSQRWRSRGRWAQESSPRCETSENVCRLLLWGDSRKIDASLSQGKGFFMTAISRMAYTLQPLERGTRLTASERRNALQFLQKVAEMAEVKWQNIGKMFWLLGLGAFGWRSLQIPWQATSIWSCSDLPRHTILGSHSPRFPNQSTGRYFGCAAGVASRCRASFQQRKLANSRSRKPLSTRRQRRYGM